jgi:hypothetical protein
MITEYFWVYVSGCSVIMESSSRRRGRCVAGALGHCPGAALGHRPRAALGHRPGAALGLRGVPRDTASVTWKGVHQSGRRHLLCALVS